ncbi:MAG: PEGA domain-containing protein [Myxococcota bacterium]|nr:PEGA domain-containing protein [Myxococcota bacterium]
MISRVQLRVGAAPGGSPARRVAVLGPCCGLLLLLAGPGLAEARERVAALVLGAEEASEPLADQCTEVLVAAVSRQTDQEIVGKEEFLARLGLPDRAGVETCLKEKTCLARAETVLGLTSMIVGYLAADRELHRLLLFKVGVDGAVGAEVKREFAGGSPEVLAGISPMLEELYRVKEALLRVESSVPGAQVYLDDQPRGTTPLNLPRVPLGLYSLRVEAPGHAVHRQALQIGEAGAQVSVVLQPAGAAASRPGGAPGRVGGAKVSTEAGGSGHEVLIWGLAAGAAVGLAGGGVFHLLAYGDATDYAATDDLAEKQDLRDRGERRWTYALVGYGAGLALAAGALTTYLVTRPAAVPARPDAPPAGPAVSWGLLLEPLPGGVLLGGGARF